MATIFKPEEEKKDQGAQPQPSGVLSATGGPTSVASQTAPQGQQPQPKGSGRFTNLQQYLQANQGAGQELGGRIGQKIQKDVSEQSQKAQDYYSQVREGVEKGQQVAQAGSGYQQQLQNIGQNIQGATGADKYTNQPQSLGIEEFVQQPGFNQFQDIQAGRAINENLLGQRQQQLGQAAQSYLGTAQDYLGNLGSESGRFNLLKQTFGGNINPQYTAGQQRLDQMLLTEQGLMPLQQQVRQDVRSASDLQRQAQLAGTDVQNLVAQEQQLIGDIGKTSMANEQSYLDMLQSYIPSVNEQRGAEWQQLQDALAAYRQPLAVGETRQGLTPEQLQRLGVTKEMGAYNVLRDLQGAEDVASRGMEATQYQDVAQQRDLDRYNMLAQIAGLSDQQKRLTGVSQIGDAYMAKEGDAALTNRLTAADDEFKRLLGVTNVNRGLSIGDNRWNVGANYGGMFEQGDEGIRTTHQFDGPVTPYTGVNAPNPYSYLNQQQIWNDFEQWMRDQGFAQTIGGAVGSSGYGTRYAPYEMTMSNMPIPDKLGGNYQPDYHEIKKG